jgi:hypothetical protein
MNVPQIISEVGFDFHWDNEKVWMLQVPTITMDIAELLWHFDIPFLSEHESYDLSPREVLEHPDAHKKEYARMMRADTSHPIDIMENKGRWLILDGLHRLMKLYSEGRTIVTVRVIPRERIPEILK